MLLFQAASACHNRCIEKIDCKLPVSIVSPNLLSLRILLSVFSRSLSSRCSFSLSGSFSLQLRYFVAVSKYSCLHMSVVAVVFLLSLADGFLFAGQSDMLSTQPSFTLIEFFSLN